MARRRKAADIKAFETKARTGPVLKRFFDEADVVLEYAGRLGPEASSPKGWELFARLPTHLDEKFDIRRPIVAYQPDAVELELANARALRTLIHRAGGQVEPDIGFLLTDDPQAEQKVGDWRNILHDFRVIPLVADESALLSTTDVGLVLEDILAHWLFGRNLYDDRGPVVGDHFFGRAREIAKLYDHALEGKHSGVFGLRKIGKTSLLYAVRDRLRSKANALPVFVDLQSAAIGPVAAGAAWQAAKELAKEVGSTDLPVSSAEVEKSLRLPALPGDVEPDQLIRDFCTGLGVLLNDRLPGMTLVLMMDEIEVFFPPRGVEAPFVPEFLRGLRALAQQHGRLSLILAGVNASPFEQTRLGEADNPFFQLVSPHYVGPLGIRDCQEMIRSLGRKMGLTWNAKALTRLVSETGRHPALARLAASDALDISDAKRKITEQTVVAVLAEFHHRHGPRFREMTESLERYHPTEYELLRELISGDRKLVREYREAYPDELNHLEEYGILAKDLEIKIPVLRNWLQSDLGVES